MEAQPITKLTYESFASLQLAFEVKLNFLARCSQAQAVGRGRNFNATDIETQVQPFNQLDEPSVEVSA